MQINSRILIVVLLGFLASSAPGEDWNQWRGPGRDSRTSIDGLPPKLNDHLKLVWQKPHSPSYSGPIVCDGLLFTTETIDKATERVTAYQIDSGEVAWTTEWPGSMAVPFFAASNGDWIRSTPACANGHLVVLGIRDVLVSLDPKTGDEQWRVDFPTSLGTPLPAFGAVCSPLIDGDGVYVQTGGGLVKLSLADGSLVWKSLETGGDMMSSGAFSSPTIATLAGVRQLLVQTREELCGVDMATGNAMWREPIEAFRGMNILTPTVIGDRIFTSAHSGRAQLLKVTRADGNWKVTEVWSQKTQAYMSSPVVIGDTIYLHAKNQRLTAIAIEDGEIRWTSEPFGKYWSMIAADDRLLALDETGELLLIADDESNFNLIDRMKVADDAWAHLAIQGDRLIVRDLSALKVFQIQD